LLVACGGAVTGAMGATDGKEDGGGVGGSGGSGNVVSGGRANVGAGGIGNGSGGRMQSGAGGIGRAGAAGSFDAGAGGTVMKPPKSCVFGTSTPCACDFGLTGARLCLVTGVFGDCSCPVRVPTCQDGVRNGNETDVDCGGTCRVCAVGLACSMNTGGAGAELLGWSEERVRNGRRLRRRRLPKLRARAQLPGSRGLCHERVFPEPCVRHRRVHRRNAKWSRNRRRLRRVLRTVWGRKGLFGRSRLHVVGLRRSDLPSSYLLGRREERDRE
jgi:hypothetical protein